MSQGSLWFNGICLRLVTKRCGFCFICHSVETKEGPWAVWTSAASPVTQDYQPQPRLCHKTLARVSWEGRNASAKNGEQSRITKITMSTREWKCSPIFLFFFFFSASLPVKNPVKKGHTSITPRRTILQNCNQLLERKKNPLPSPALSLQELFLKPV